MLVRTGGLAAGVAGAACLASGAVLLHLSGGRGVALTTDAAALVGVLSIVAGLLAVVLPVVGFLLYRRSERALAAVEDMREERDALLSRVVRLERSLEHVSVIGEIHVAGNISDRYERLHALLTAVAAVTGAERIGLYLVTSVPERKAVLRGYYERLGAAQVYLYVDGECDWWQAGDLAFSGAEEDTVGSRTLLSSALVREGETIARIEVETTGRTPKTRSPSEKLLSFIRRIRPDDGGVEDVFQSPRPLVDTVEGRGRHLVLYPLWAEGQMVGALRLEISPDVIPAQRIGEVTSALDQAALHVALAVRKEQHRHRAEVDGLTGLYLKRHFSQTISALCRSENGPPLFSLLMIDVDHFKKVNDTCGHLAGDAVLKGVAGVIRRSLRTGDSAFRYGGEEMTVILHGMSADEARAIAERLRRLVQESAFSAAGASPPLSVTVSIGVAESRRGLAPDDIVAAADSALYQAKKSGRNRVCVYNVGAERTRSGRLRKARTARQKAS